MRWLIHLIVCALVAEAALGAAPDPSILEYSARPETTNNFAEASFSCLAPAQKPRAILFLAGGTDSDARPWLNDPRWRALAAKEDLVLIAGCLRGAGEAYEMADRGSGQALLDAIAVFARDGACPEMTRLPLLLYGHSAGAQFAFRFACWKPEMVRAIIEMKSGPLPQPSFHEAPPFRALFIVGEHDLPGRVREVTRAFAAGRTHGALWCLACQPNAGHGVEGCRELAERFIHAVNADPTPSGGYAGISAADFKTSVSGATDPHQSWLPNTTFWQAWRSFAKDLPLESLLAMPETPAEIRVSLQPITALPDRLDIAQPRGSFEYLVSIPNESAAITQATVRASSPAVHVTVARQSEREWSVAGECDLRGLPLGPFKSSLDIDLTTATGTHEHGESSLFTLLTGPIAIRPSSLYYGVIERETTVEFPLEIRPRGDLAIQSCDAISSDPQFLSVTVSSSKTPGAYLAKCTIQSGSRIGARNGRLTFRVAADRASYEINVPFYGFIKK